MKERNLEFLTFCRKCKKKESIEAEDMLALIGEDAFSRALNHFGEETDGVAFEFFGPCPDCGTDTSGDGELRALREIPQ